jgi:DNA polymerase-1
MKAVSEMEGNGIPINLVSLKALREMWPEIQDQLIIEIDRDYGVYEGKTFKSARFAEWLRKRQIAWPRLESGQFDFKEETFREMSRSHPEVAPIKELRSTLSKMRLNDLAVGGDSRNRTMLSPLRSKTGRNQPSSKHFIFGPAVWLRGLIKPREGYGIAYIDWSQQEFGTAAALSGDEGMLAAYQSDDPYLSFAKQAGAVPANATKESHGSIREQFKACVLAVQYGMGEVSLASRIGQSVAKARELLDLHLRTYPVFWKWSDSVVDYAMFNNELYTVFGWNLFIQENPKVTPNDRSIRNFPMQANGAEMLRLACCLCVENGITVCAPVHDALLIEAPLENLDDQVKLTQELMAEASRIVLGGFSLKSDADIYRFPERYMDKRGEKMWEKVWGLVDSRTSQQGQSINQ